MRTISTSKLEQEIRMATLLVAFLAFIVPHATGAMLHPKASAAYEEYCRNKEIRMQRSLSATGFLWTDTLHGAAKVTAQAQLAQGRVFEQCVAGCDSSGVPVPGGLIHDWIGVVFVPGATLPQTLALVQNYDDASTYYSPHVARSRLLRITETISRCFCV